MGKCERILQPGICLEVVEIIEIAELVALMHHAVGIVQIILQQVGRKGDLTVAERVDVDPELTTEQVADSLVVYAACIVQTYTCLQCEHRGQLSVQIGVEHRVELIGMTVLKDIARAFLLSFGQCLVLNIVQVVDVVKVIPVDLTERRIVLPQIGVEIILLLIVLEV